MSIKETLPLENSHIYILTDMPLDETPDIHSDSKNFLPVHPTEVFLVKEKKNGGSHPLDLTPEIIGQNFFSSFKL